MLFMIVCRHSRPTQFDKLYWLESIHVAIGIGVVCCSSLDRNSMDGGYGAIDASVWESSLSNGILSRQFSIVRVLYRYCLYQYLCLYWYRQAPTYVF
jgi:hypothetical protein